MPDELQKAWRELAAEFRETIRLLKILFSPDEDDA